MMKTHASQEKTAERNMIELESGCLVHNLNIYDDCSNTCGVFITQHFFIANKLTLYEMPTFIPVLQFIFGIAVDELFVALLSNYSIISAVCAGCYF